MVAPGGGAWLLGGGHAWLLPGGGACVVAPGGGGACMVAPRGACMVVPGGGGAGVRGIRRDTEIRSMSGRYASYWNAFLFIIFFDDF